MQNTNVLIIGGGLSGLYLATELQKLGIPYLLVEARDRLGGRILGVEGFDLGPTWFWPGHNLMAGLLDNLALNYYPQYTHGEALYQTSNQLYRIAQPATGVSYRVVSGMQSMVDALLSRIPHDKTFLGCQVNVIRQTPDGILVTGKICRNPTESGQYAQQFLANKVVLAMPPRLVSSMLEFEPKLPANFIQEISATPTWMAGHAKAIIRYPQAFWRQQGLSGFTFSQTGPLMELHDASLDCGDVKAENKCALFGFFALSPAQRKELGRNKLQELIRTQLVVLYGSPAAHPVDIIIQDWAAESFTANVADSSPLNYHPVYAISQSQCWNGRLIFAASENASQHGGFLEGALIASQAALKWCCK